MKRLMAAVCMAGLMGTAAAAQTGSMPMGKTGQGKTDQGKMGKSTTVTGCVAEGSETGRYTLANGTTTGDTTGKSYDLIGGDLKAHVGHKVEVTGTIADGKAMGKDKMMAKDKMEKGEGEGEHKMAKDTMAKDTMGTAGTRSTLQVKSVKMIAATCP
jgi:hypothetical protein